MSRILEIPAVDRAFFGIFVAALVEAAAQSKLTPEHGTALLWRLTFEPDAQGQPIKAAISDAFLLQILNGTVGQFLDTVFAYMDPDTQNRVNAHFNANPAQVDQLAATVGAWHTALKTQHAELAKTGAVPALTLLKGRAA